jgi:hypothetical protein
MDRREFEAWLDRYGRAWETQDSGMAAELFSKDAVYFEAPFDEPMCGRSSIVDYWKEGGETQEDIGFGYDVLAVAESSGIARWWARFTRIPSGSRVELDGVLVASLDPDNRCDEFREWWHRRERNPQAMV